MLKLQERSIKWALKSIEKHFDSYIFPMPFEYEAIKYKEQDVVDHIKNIDVLNQGIRDYRTSLTPKSIKGFRISTQLDPIDSIISHAVIYEISDEIERARIPKSDSVIHSFRLKPESDGTMYDPDYSWSSFINRAQEIVETGEFPYVLVTDISDFYSSIYLHYVETVLREVVTSSGKYSHTKVLINYIKAMNLNQTHKGIPIGPQFSRPIAELILNDIDCSIISRGTKYLRYVDDIFLFSKSESDAFINLSFLAQSLYDQRNLKLNEKKTEIYTIEEFSNKYLIKPNQIEENSILSRFTNLLQELDIDQDPYEEIGPDDLTEDDWERLKSVNILNILEIELTKKEPNSFLISFLLGNLARIDNHEAANIVLKEENIYKLFPKLRTIINYLERVRSFSEESKHEIGSKVLELIENSVVGTLAFNRMWFLNLFTKSGEWDNEDKFVELFKKFVDPISQRELFLALGRSKNVNFYRINKTMSLDINNWIRRAFIAGISCLPKDEREPWYKSRSLRSRDFLDTIIEDWAKNNPL